MKKALLGAASALLMVGAAGAASAQSTGFAGISYSDLSNDLVDATAVTLEATTSFDVSQNWELQLDGEIGTVDVDFFSSQTFWGPTGHFFYDGNGYKAGVFLGYEDLDDLGDAFGYGLEGRFELSDSVTLGGAAAWSTFSADGLPDIDMSSYGADLSIFANDNLRFDVGAALVDADFGPFSGDTTVFGLGAEWQLQNAPVSFTATYEAASSDLAFGDVDTISIGVRRTWGGSLKDRDRSSSPFGNMLSRFGGLGGTAASGFSIVDNIFDCATSDDFCGIDEEAFDDFLSEFDGDLLEELYCELYDCD